MEKTIKSKELLNAIQKIKADANCKIYISGDEKEMLHGLGMADAMAMLEKLLNIEKEG